MVKSDNVLHLLEAQVLQINEANLVETTNAKPKKLLCSQVQNWKVKGIFWERKIFPLELMDC